MVVIEQRDVFVRRPIHSSNKAVKDLKKRNLFFVEALFFVNCKLFSFKPFGCSFFTEIKFWILKSAGSTISCEKWLFWPYFFAKRFGIKVVCRVRQPSKRPKVVLTCRKQPSGSIKIIAKKSFVCLRASKLASKDISCLVPFYVTTCDQLIRSFLRIYCTYGLDS